MFFSKKKRLYCFSKIIYFIMIKLSKGIVCQKKINILMDITLRILEFKKLMISQSAYKSIRTYISTGGIRHNSWFEMKAINKSTVYCYLKMRYKCTIMIYETDHKSSHDMYLWGMAKWDKKKKKRNGEKDKRISNSFILVYNTKGWLSFSSLLSKTYPFLSIWVF